jgi:hypothetical protein
MSKGIWRPKPGLRHCPVCGTFRRKLESHLDEIHQTDLATAQACEQRKIEDRKLAFLRLKLEVLKAENERLKKRDGGEQPGPGTRDYEALLKASRETATEVIRRSLSRTSQAGLPGLGKRR